MNREKIKVWLKYMLWATVGFLLVEACLIAYIQLVVWAGGHPLK